MDDCLRLVRLLGCHDQVSAYGAAKKLAAQILSGALLEQEGSLIFSKLWAAAMPFGSPLLELNNFRTDECDSSDFLRTASPSSCKQTEAELQEPASESHCLNRAAVNALGCLRNVLKESSIQQTEAKCNTEETREEKFGSSLCSLPDSSIQDLFLASFWTVDLETHLRELARLMSVDPCRDPCAHQTSSFCSTPQKLKNSVSASRRCALTSRDAEIILCAILRLLSTTVKVLRKDDLKLEAGGLLGSKTKRNNDMQRVRKLINDVVERTWGLIVAATALHVHQGGEQCLFGYIQHKLTAILLPLIQNSLDHIGVAPPFILSFIKAVGRNLRLFFASPPALKGDNTASSELYASPFYSSWIVSNIASQLRHKPAKVVVPNIVKIRILLIFLKAGGGFKVVPNDSSSPPSDLQAESFVSLITSLHHILLSAAHIDSPVDETKAVVQVDQERGMKGEYCEEEGATKLLLLLQEQDDVMLDVLYSLHYFTPSLQHICDSRGHSSYPTLRITREQIRCIMESLQPLRLFHAFLSLLSHDHFVLLDYLVSPDSIAPFMPYLLRTLALIASTWPEILQINIPAGSNSESEIVGGRRKRVRESQVEESSKRANWKGGVGEEGREDSDGEGRSTLKEGRDKIGEMTDFNRGEGVEIGSQRCDSSESLSQSSAEWRDCKLGGNGAVNSVEYGGGLEGERMCVEGDGRGVKSVGSEKRVLVNGVKTVECLQALRKSIERLHQSGQFPYNPTALVRRLVAVERLWMGEEGAEGCPTTLSSRQCSDTAEPAAGYSSSSLS